MKSNLPVYEYVRVLPRDLFNEAKLLKCIGFLALSVHDGKLRELTLNCNAEDDEETRNHGKYIEGGFDIGLCDEGLFIKNITFNTPSGEEVFFVSPYNSRDNFPLHFEREAYLYEPVFTETGEFSEEFIDFLAEIERNDLT